MILIDRLKDRIEEIEKMGKIPDIRDIAISGVDLINSGFEAKEIGKIKNEVYNLILGEELENEKEAVISYLSEKYNLGKFKQEKSCGAVVYNPKKHSFLIIKMLNGNWGFPKGHTEDQETDIQLITGPNMSGKSTYMRQLAIIVIMAQMGSYVPAQSASLPLFDAIFTRIGAADDLVSGQSTFMVEMMEANRAIRLFDELGRGTATYDGMALAQAIIEHIHHHTGAKTLFATHYHELTALENSLEHLENVHVATLEKDGQVTFLHKIEPGPADKSYGIHVAKIAGLPEKLLERADSILSHLESQDTGLDIELPAEYRQTRSQVAEQMSLFAEGTENPVLTELRDLDIYNMTPLEVMAVVAELKKKL